MELENKIESILSNVNGAYSAFDKASMQVKEISQTNQALWKVISSLKEVLYDNDVYLIKVVEEKLGQINNIVNNASNSYTEKNVMISSVTNAVYEVSKQVENISNIVKENKDEKLNDNLKTKINENNQNNKPLYETTNDNIASSEDNKTKGNYLLDADYQLNDFKSQFVNKLLNMGYSDTEIEKYMTENILGKTGNISSNLNYMSEICKNIDGNYEQFIAAITDIKESHRNLSLSINLESVNEKANEKTNDNQTSIQL